MTQVVATPAVRVGDVSVTAMKRGSRKILRPATALRKGSRSWAVAWAGAWGVAWTGAALSCALSFGCKSNQAADPAQGLPKATIAEARTEPSLGTAAYTFSAKDSSIAFVGSNLASTQEGKFTAFSGSISAPDTDPAHATVSFTAEVGSIQTSSPDLTKHLLSADFLDAGKYPTLKFTSTAIGPDKQGYLVEGVLEMHGVKKQVSFPVELTLPPNAPTAKAQFTLDRQAFGVAFKGAPDNLIRDEVVVRLDIKAQAVTKP